MICFYFESCIDIIGITEMKVLMFGWEFPPHISGGLGTACYGLTQSLSKEKTDILFVVPKSNDHRPFDRMDVISASNIPFSISKADDSLFISSNSQKVVPKKSLTKLTSIQVASNLQPYSFNDSTFSVLNLEHWNYQLNEKQSHTISENKNRREVTYLFSGGYGPHLFEEISRYAEVAQQLAKNYSFNVIHAHDWLTYPAGIAAKKISGKPLVVHVHATEFDRSGSAIDQRVYNIEKMGMEQADRIIAVSQLTKNIIVSHYHISQQKVNVVYNGVLPKKSTISITLPSVGKQVITFLGRITHQKGPSYFIEAAYKVLQKFPDTHFVMAGSGDLLPKMIKRVATLKISSHFHFTGFLNSSKVDQVLSISNVFVMPSVSEPFGIAPLEAMMAGVPVIISNQSGVAEVVQHAIKVDFWDVEALANAICNLLSHKSLTKTILRKSAIEIKKINWDKAAKKINTIYHELTAQP
jgi:glycogen synthase